MRLADYQKENLELKRHQIHLQNVWGWILVGLNFIGIIIQIVIRTTK